jgi:putative addiction module killer protein
MEIIYSNLYKKWFKSLKDNRLKATIQRKIENFENKGNHKSLGGGLYEIKIDYGAGYRVYYRYKDNKIIIILGGGDKSSQDKDIKKIRSM